MPKPYKGVLAEQVNLNELNRSRYDNNDFDDIWWPKIVALYEHYGISPSSDNRENKLILALAKAHVPGFKIKDKTGRPKKWMGDKGLQLYADILAHTVRGRSIGEACIYLSTNNPDYTSYTPAQLKARYFEIKRDYSIVRCLENMVKAQGDDAKHIIIETFSSGTKTN